MSVHIFSVHSLKSKRCVVEDFPITCGFCFKIIFLIFILLYLVIFFEWGIWLQVILFKKYTFLISLLWIILFSVLKNNFFTKYKNTDPCQIITNFYADSLESFDLVMGKKIKQKAWILISQSPELLMTLIIINAFCSQNQVSQPCVFKEMFSHVL